MPRLQGRVALFLSLATRLTKRFAAFAFFSVLIMCPVYDFAQDTGTGMPAFNSFSHAGGGIDTINLGNLNVHMEIPLRSLGAYGPTASADLVLDSLITKSTGNPSGWLPPTPFMIQTSGQDSVQNLTHKGTNCAPWPADTYTITAKGVLDIHNTYHDTPSVTVTGCNTSSASLPGSDGWAIVGTLNSTGSGTWYAIAPNGNATTCPAVIPTLCTGTGTTDPHGNSVTSTLYMFYGQTGVGAGGTLADALGNTTLQGSAPGSTVLFTYPGPNSSTSTYTLSFTQKNIQAAFGCIGDQSGSTSGRLLTGITFPDLSTMSFGYEPVYNSANTTGRIASVKLRTGATITYDYTGYGTHGINCSDGSTAGFKKKMDDGTFWEFTHSAPNGPGLLTQTTVKAPSGDVTTYLFSGLYPTQIYDAAHINVSTICYYGNATSCTNRSTPPTLPITERDVFTVVGGMTSSSLKVFQYDNYSRLTDVKTYNSGGVINGANFATEETFGYGTWNNSSCSVQNETVQGVLVPITGLICYNTVWTPGVGNPVADMTREYYPNTADVKMETVTRYRLVA